MNIKRLALSIIAVFLALFVTDFLIHGVWLAETYRATASLWRPELEAGTYMGWLLLAQLVWTVAFVLIWANGLAAKATLRCALLYGLCMGLFYSSNTLILYSVQPFPGTLAAKWFFANTAQGVVMGLIAFFVYRPKAGADQPTPPQG